MSYEEEFDKIVRQKAEEADYPFDAGNWEKAREMMDNERTTATALSVKKRVIAGGLAVGVGIIALIVFKFTNTTTLDQPGVNSIHESSPGINKQISDNTVQAPVNTPESPLKPDLSPSSADQNSTEKVKPTAPEQSESPIAKVVETEKPHTADAPEVRPEEGSLDIAVNMQPVESPHSVSRSEEPITNNVSNESASPFAGLTNKNVLPLAAAAQTGVGSAEVSPPAADPVQSAAELPSAAIPAAESGMEQMLVEELQLISSALPYASSEYEIKNLPFVLLKRYEDEYISAKLKTHQVNVELGANYLLGWDAANGTDGSGLNWFGGFNYRYYVTNKFSVGAGIQAYNISNITQPFFSSSQKNYGFGFTNTYTTVTSTDLYFVSIPLKFVYDLNTAHQLGLSFNVGYLAGAKSTFSSYEVSDAVVIEQDPITKNGVYEGARRSNYLLGIFYNAHITRKLAVNAEFTFGLSDVFKNYGEITNTEKTTGYRLSLQYTLFER